MQMMNIYADKIHNFHKWRNELETLEKFILVISFAILTGLAAQVRILTPFSPIPITGQVFAVLLAGVVLGKNWGGASQILYVTGGIAGIPWFSGFTGGLSILSGFTVGYLAGFVVVAFAIGYIVETFTVARKTYILFPIMLLSVGVIYTFGAAWFAFVTGLDLYSVFKMAVLPFIALDIGKAVLATGAATLLTTRRPYGPEKY